ncbi:galactosylceramide sulfotransferase [Micractinium conductrix]|uniref:Galactosylceramide sulfotransferase n=1 Tax=Micractinium conductrix TaxID=554055 RepID=A0A2P6V973_9CHLO|nr:galactosylceramide sulfotransferase [Micractinium conductrix]|eukprot:PSC70625.1 galactosylceramide sulfotransferase [Micractinium conductrix]
MVGEGAPSRRARLLLAVALGALVGSLLLEVPATQHGRSSAALRLQGVPAAALVEAFLAAPLPPRNLAISEEAPLFFFHQRKTGGTSLRAAMAATAVARNLSEFVPCFTFPNCEVYHIETPAAVYAAHFPWGEQRILARHSRFVEGRWHNPRLRASCLTMFREPMARLESCYYYRFIQERNLSDSNPHYGCLSNLSTEELRHMFLAGRTQYGRGCLNEPFRVLGGFSDELDLAVLSATTEHDNTFLSAALAMTLSHLATCVPLVLERPDSLQLAQHWFPQLADAFKPLVRNNTGAAERCPMSERTRAALAELARGEQILYDAALRRVDAMLATLPA